MATIFLKQLFDLLNEKYLYAVLRNHESLPDSIASRDIDILLQAEQLKAFQQDCVLLAFNNSFKVLYTHQDNQFWSIVLCSVNKNNVQLIQIDIMVNLDVMGVMFLNERHVLSDRVFNGKVYHLPLKYVFLCKYIYSRVLNVAYPEKYKNIKQEIQASYLAEVDTILSTILNKPNASINYWESARGRTLMLLGLLASFRRNPLLQIKRLSLFLIWNLKHRFSRRGLLISISGPDGSGKTTVIQKVIDILGAVNPPLLYHFRPKLLPNLGEIGKKVKVISSVDQRFDEPHRSQPNGFVKSSIRLTYYIFDYIFGYFLKILPLLYKKNIVIFDRYFTDMIVDGERSSIYLNFKYIFMLRRIVPSCNYNFLIKVDPEIILSRKQELTHQAIERIYSRLEYVADRDESYYWIENNSEPEDAVIRIISVLLENQHRIYFQKLISK